ncbi:MAG TPA: sigma-70 family RNA polymerase sigma factor [Planctomycetota bacterium]|nr:sigma-70 family RNA polymerase sigma factor [Planctomycetota bacterium]
MSSSQPLPRAENLLAQQRCLRAIVRGLLRSADGEDDVVQEALVRAWQADHPVRFAAWLARIARNLSFDHLRAAHREERLRRLAPARDPAPSTDEVLQQEEQRRRVVHAVLALPQLYRAVVLLRYWEELTPAQIAARLDVPAPTVRSQLKRGLAMLRERLDHDYGDRGAWLAALAPFAGAPHALAFGTLLMTKTKIVVASLLLVGIAALLWPWSPPAPPAPRSSDATQSVAAAPAAVAGDPSTGQAAAPPAAPSLRAAAMPDGELSVRGQVLCRNLPYPGLTLGLRWFAGFSASGAPAAEHTIVCDDEGRFEWRGRSSDAPRTVVAVAAQRDLHLWCDGAIVTPDQHDVTLGVSVLPFDRVLFGRVHDAGGAPIAGAVLNVNGFDETEVTSDGIGHYAMPVPAPGYPLRVRAPGYRQRLIQSYLPVDAMRHEYDVELQPGGKVEGRVVDGDGHAIAGARVRASYAYHTVETDAEGQFVVEGVPAAQRVTVAAVKPRFRRARAEATAGGEPVEIVLQPGLRVVLHVVDRDSAPVVGATVNVVYDPPMGAWTRRGVTALDGRLTLDDLSEEPVEVVVSRHGFTTVQRPLDAGAQDGDVEITLQAGYTLRGVVLDTAGRPVAGASVTCGQGATTSFERRQVGAPGRSGVDGRFEITGLPPEPCTLVAHHPDYNQGELTFVGGAIAETVVRLSPAPAVAGRVIDGATNAPIVDFTVELQTNALVLPLFLDPVPFHSEHGSFAVRNWQLKTGVPMSAIVAAEGFAPVRVRTEALLDPSPDQNLVRLFTGTRVEGVVRDPASGQPVAGVTLALVNGDPRLRPNGGPATDETGRFAIDSVPPGEQQLRLQHADRPEVVFGPFVVGPGPGALEVHPTMGVGVALRGRITGIGSAAGITMMAHRRDGRIANGTVRADLTFEIAGLGAGLTMLRVADGQRRVRTLRVEVGESDVDDFVFPLRSGAGSVRVDVDGVARGVADVERLDVPAGVLAPIDRVEFEGGAFTVDGLVPGRYRVDVRGDHGARGRAEVDIGAGEVGLRVEVRAPK